MQLHWLSLRVTSHWKDIRFLFWRALKFQQFHWDLYVVRSIYNSKQNYFKHLGQVSFQRSRVHPPKAKISQRATLCMTKHDSFWHLIRRWVQGSAFLLRSPSCLPVLQQCTFYGAKFGSFFQVGGRISCAATSFPSRVTYSDRPTFFCGSTTQCNFPSSSQLFE